MRKSRSLKNEGFLPSTLWPQNCPIHATTKMINESAHSGMISSEAKYLLPARQSKPKRPKPIDSEKERVR